MLLRFKVENYKSFKEGVSLSMITNSKIQNKKYHEVDCNNLSVLKYSTIYGGNASGKTNLFTSIHALKSLLVKDYSNIDLAKFKDNKKESITFEITFEKNDLVFNYLVSLKELKSFKSYEVVNEILSLYDLKNREENIIFDNKGVHHDSSREINKIEDLYYENCRKDKEDLFLSYINRPDLEMSNSDVQKLCKIAFEFICKDLVFVNNESNAYSNINDATIKDITEHLSRYDTGIKEVKFADCSEEEVMNFLPKSITQQIKNSFLNKSKENQSLTLSFTNGKYIFNLLKKKDGNVQIRKIVSSHKGFKTLFSFDEESDGSKRLILLCALLFSKGEDKVYIFDELERSLHPELVTSIIEDFIELNKNKKSQLIFTTHLPMLMDEVLRKDEINILDKNPNGESKITRLLCFKDVRSDTKLSKNYIEGRYGGVPRIDQLFS